MDRSKDFEIKHIEGIASNIEAFVNDDRNVNQLRACYSNDVEQVKKYIPQDEYYIWMQVASHIQSDKVYQFLKESQNEKSSFVAEPNPTNFFNRTLKREDDFLSVLEAGNPLEFGQFIKEKLRFYETYQPLKVSPNLKNQESACREILEIAKFIASSSRANDHKLKPAFEKAHAASPQMFFCLLLAMYHDRYYGKNKQLIAETMRHYFDTHQHEYTVTELEEISAMMQQLSTPAPEPKARPQAKRPTPISFSLNVSAISTKKAETDSPAIYAVYAVQTKIKKLKRPIRPGIQLSKKEFDPQILKVLIDFDGCVSRQSIADRKLQEKDIWKALIKDNFYLVKGIYDVLIKYKIGKLRLALGSNRQDKGVDDLNEKNNQNGSCMLLLPLFQAYLQTRFKLDKLECETKLDTFLMADLPAYADNPQHKFGDAYKAILKEKYALDPQKSEQEHIRWQFDKHKVSIDYPNAHKLSIENPDCDSLIRAYDDSEEILKTRLELFKAKPWMLPENIKLELWLYSETENYLYGSIQGTGLADPHYYLTVLKMYELYYQDNAARYGYNFSEVWQDENFFLRARKEAREIAKTTPNEFTPPQSNFVTAAELIQSDLINPFLLEGLVEAGLISAESLGQGHSYLTAAIR
jgi:hypothetical protein